MKEGENVQNEQGLTIENSSSRWNQASLLSASLIKGLLRKNQKMMIAAPPRSLKTSVSLQLCKAIADGEKWLGWEVKQGDVLIVGCGADKQNMLNRISRLYEKVEESKSYEFIDYVTIKGETSMPTVINQVIDSVRKQGKTYRLIILDSIDYVQPLEGYSVHSTIAALDRLTIECNCSVVVTHTVRREFSDKSYIDNLNVIHNDILLSLFDTYIEFVEIKLKDKHLNDLQVNQVKNYFTEVLKEHRFDYYKENITDNFFKKERSVDELRRHLEIAIRESEEKRTLDFFDSLFTPIKNDTYWQMVAYSSGIFYPQTEQYIFRYPLLKEDADGLLTNYSTGVFAFWDSKSSQESPPEEVSYIKTEKANKELTAACEKFEKENGTGETPHKKDIARIIGMSEKTVERRVEESDIFYMEKGKIFKFI
ncbi:hypothetical protein BW721_04865 [Jeotgalibaca sp. PTS2502]|uniref:AAA family ATPase n=1 Tax=Jeotgalibaca sp. PTS2502 TaxID=1903686 RepID=UPI000973A6C8|nr:AAA family ATPase [Jeotgalibaca sp. PTS2502]APZ49068.1 hypothetical protein BW721_04865 [Jeotgalibaca sp. PTS2502]